jgi:hypothetical protein
MKLVEELARLREKELEKLRHELADNLFEKFVV